MKIKERGPKNDDTETKHLERGSKNKMAKKQNAQKRESRNEDPVTKRLESKTPFSTLG